MKDFPLYLIMISYGRADSALSVIGDYLEAKKPTQQTTFIVVENGDAPFLRHQFDFDSYNDISYCHFPNKNKAAAINFALRDLIPEQEALVICIDNDIHFEEDYLQNYFESALEKGSERFFGSSFYVNIPDEVDLNLIPFLQGSATGKPDAEFKKMKESMFLGFNYSFFKSQWKQVKGLDERFSPGSKYNLAAEESVFQKKLKQAGFKPYFVEGNSVEHKPLPESYIEENVLLRKEQNGYTHGFQDLIIKPDKIFYLKRFIYHLKRCLALSLKRDQLSFRMRYAYTKGYLKAFLLYLRINNKNSYLKF